jgi:hypothetical protein
MPQKFTIKNERIAAWLRSNPVADPHKSETKVVLIYYENGMLRWPLVSDQFIAK